MRIIGGEASGRRLAAPSGSATRPTGDRVREALFNIWQGTVHSSRLLDLYAGTGAVGIEALSRGAGYAAFCEPSPKARRVLSQNLSLVGFQDRAEILPMKAEGALPVFLERDGQFDLIFCDPPWEHGMSIFVKKEIGRLLAPGGMLVIESRRSDAIEEISGLTRRWSRTYGDTRLSAFEGES